jgi:hypothetical protein
MQTVDQISSMNFIWKQNHLRKSVSSILKDVGVKTVAVCDVILCNANSITVHRTCSRTLLSCYYSKNVKWSMLTVQQSCISSTSVLLCCYLCCWYIPPITVRASFCGIPVTRGFLVVVIVQPSLCILVYLAMTWTDLTNQFASLYPDLLSPLHILFLLVTIYITLCTALNFSVAVSIAHSNRFTFQTVFLVNVI